MDKSIVFIDIEVSEKDAIVDMGAIKDETKEFHSCDLNGFHSFIYQADYIGGHNIVSHDLAKLYPVFERESKDRPKGEPIDTLLISALLYPNKTSHSLVKEDKISDAYANNPLNDSIGSLKLFHKEVEDFNKLKKELREIYCALLYKFKGFKGFFDYIGIVPNIFKLRKRIMKQFKDLICEHCALENFIEHNPIELAYALSFINVSSLNAEHSAVSPWIINNYPIVSRIMRRLKNTRCKEGCNYCSVHLNIKYMLYDIFKFKSFRKYDNLRLQEEAVQCAVDGKSLLAVFPTGGGKSITFQLPAIMAGRNMGELTVVISPLKSLMKDQVDNLNNKILSEAVRIDSSLDSISRKAAIESVTNGTASLLYIAPEQLRSNSICNLLKQRTISRFVIDEAHCFSAWGHDFRVDYRYIGEFIKKYQTDLGLDYTIPVSCFTATAKPKVISDIQDYFKEKLGLELELFAANPDRKNLQYKVFNTENEDDKFRKLLEILHENDCPTIVYVSSVKLTEKIAEKLRGSNYSALAYNGKMDTQSRNEAQEKFINNEANIMVATTAFGMGVDKDDIGLVVHYEISSSLENYMQESGRAGRKENSNAKCYILFNKNDLQKHFFLLKSSKVSQHDIQCVWKAIKSLCNGRDSMSCSSFELAKRASLNKDPYYDTKIKTAISALEDSGYIKRLDNKPRIFATTLKPKSMIEASQKLEMINYKDEAQERTVRLLMQHLFSNKSIEIGAKGEMSDNLCSFVDHIADSLERSVPEIIDALDVLKSADLIGKDNDSDMSVYFTEKDTANKAKNLINSYCDIDKFVLEQIKERNGKFSVKQLNNTATRSRGIKSCSAEKIKSIIGFYILKGYYNKPQSDILDDDNINDDDEEGNAALESQTSVVKNTLVFADLEKKQIIRKRICTYVIDKLYSMRTEKFGEKGKGKIVFSVGDLYSNYLKEPRLYDYELGSLDDFKDALLFLSKVRVMTLENGFLVMYNKLKIQKMQTNNKIQYKNEDYKKLNEYYLLRTHQIHIVGEFANTIVSDYNKGIEFIHDYFTLDYNAFIKKHYFGRENEINMNMTLETNKLIYGGLSEIQTQIINDDSKYVVVAAGPGSGKTKLLVHKLASLLYTSEMSSDQLLMLTFSRGAANEFKQRLIELIKGPAYSVKIKTFHSYCLDILGQLGDSNSLKNLIGDTVKEIRRVIEENKDAVDNSIVKDLLSNIDKRYLVIDEAQDIGKDEFELIKLLLELNEDMKIMAVGDDDQNIYEFREPPSDSKYMKILVDDYGAKLFEMTDNYRSNKNIVDLANIYVNQIKNRLKTKPIRAMTNNLGTIKITKHTTWFLENAILQDIVTNGTNNSCCVLALENKETDRMVGLLRHHNIRAQYIQNIENLDVGNLVEMRTFVMLLSKKLGPCELITADQWADAEKGFAQRFSNSSCYRNCVNIINKYKEQVNDNLYISTFNDFVNESKYEDYYDDAEKGTVCVSTMHKAKGKEFDDVYLMLSDMSWQDNYNEKLNQYIRLIYVAITRAKKNLYIHYVGNEFDFLSEYGYNIEMVNDRWISSESPYIVLQLSFSDINLGYNDIANDKDKSKNNKKEILKLRSGDKLIPRKDEEKAWLYFDTDRTDISLVHKGKNKDHHVIKASKSFNKAINDYYEQGYEIVKSKINFITAYQCGNQDADKNHIPFEWESAVILPEIHLLKK